MVRMQNNPEQTEGILNEMREMYERLSKNDFREAFQSTFTELEQLTHHKQQSTTDELHKAFQSASKPVSSSSTNEEANAVEKDPTHPVSRAYFYKDKTQRREQSKSKVSEADERRKSAQADLGADQEQAPDSNDECSYKRL